MKNRNIPILEFLHFLQLEYLTHRFRRSIYPLKRDRDYHERVMIQKREKIVDIATKNNIINIFSSQEEMQRYRELVYPKYGFDGNVLEFTLKDKKFLYCEGADVVVLLDEHTEQIGYIARIIERERFFECIVKGKSELVQVAVKNLRRILP